MPAPLDLSIILVNWHSAGFVRQCVRSIRRETTGLAIEIIVVDNASYDGCRESLRELDPEARYLQSHENLGFARANNLGVAASRGAGLLFLNPDTEVMGPAIQRLHRALWELPGAGAVGARLLNGDGSVQTSCIQSFPTLLNQALDSDWLRRKRPHWALWGTQPLHCRPARPMEVEGISGACLLIRRDVFEEVGRFSEDYFMYGEDMDLCLKVRRAGWKNYYVPEAEVIHFGGGSSRQAVSSFSAVMMRESIWRFLRKTRGDLYGRGYRCVMLGVAACRLGLLGLGFPYQRLRGRSEGWRGSFGKWWAILLWSLGQKALN